MRRVILIDGRGSEDGRSAFNRIDRVLREAAAIVVHGGFVEDLSPLLGNRFGVGDGEVILARQDTSRVGVLLNRVSLERNVDKVMTF